jgi:glutamate/tyrosine decarboxylase-like PLP-dependent enzyme
VRDRPPRRAGLSDTRNLLSYTAGVAADFLDGLDERPVFPPGTVDELRAALGGPLPAEPTAPRRVVEELADAADRGIVAMAGGRYFGFVIGGSVPAALAADWLTSTWDQNAGLYVAGPAAAVAEEIAGDWLRELFGLPQGATYGFVTGAQMANFTGLAAARHAVLARAGWDVGRDGLAGGPRVRVVVGAKRHSTIDGALRMLGLGAPSEVVEADEQGRMRAAPLRDVLGSAAAPTIVCAQAGEVNSGAFDPLEEIADACTKSGAWLHVDGAFGLWASVSPELSHLVRGVERADSWATDAHKWLNVPYDCGVVFCAHPEAHRAAMSRRGEYLVFGEGAERDAMDWSPESSRRARGIPVYAALRSLGVGGVRALVERCCAHARRFAREVEGLGGDVLNEVVLNQVLVRFGSDERTQAVLKDVQRGGEAWLGGTRWKGSAAIRISVSNWQTSDRDVERTVAAFEAALGRTGESL